MSAFFQFFKCVNAELYKLKGTPVRWLILLGGILVPVMITISFITSPYQKTTLNVNPWGYYYKLTSDIFSSFILLPIIVLISSYVVNLEHQSNTWKGLYSMPIQRAYFYFSKLFSIIILVFTTLLVYFFAALILGYLMSFIFPEFEFQYYFPNLGELAPRFVHLTIGVLACIALQYWLSMHFKNFLLPVMIGVLGYIIGFLMYISGTKYGLYFPYTHPALVNDLDIIQSGLDKKTGTLLNKVEYISMALFVLFAGLGYLEERRKDVK